MAETPPSTRALKVRVRLRREQISLVLAKAKGDFSRLKISKWLCKISIRVCRAIKEGTVGKALAVFVIKLI